MVPGATSSRNVVGNDLPDPFYDSYREEALACCDIIELMGKVDTPFVRVTFDKTFLKHIVHSHILYIRKMELT